MWRNALTREGGETSTKRASQARHFSPSRARILQLRGKRLQEYVLQVKRTASDARTLQKGFCRASAQAWSLRCCSTPIASLRTAAHSAQIRWNATTITAQDDG